MRTMTSTRIVISWHLPADTSKQRTETHVTSRAKQKPNSKGLIIRHPIQLYKTAAHLDSIHSFAACIKCCTNILSDLLLLFFMALLTLAVSDRILESVCSISLSNSSSILHKHIETKPKAITRPSTQIITTKTQPQTHLSQCFVQSQARLTKETDPCSQNAGTDWTYTCWSSNSSPIAWPILFRVETLAPTRTSCSSCFSNIACCCARWLSIKSWLDRSISFSSLAYRPRGFFSLALLSKDCKNHGKAKIKKLI